MQINLTDPAAYAAWRDRKLALYPADPATLWVEIINAGQPSPVELAQLRARVQDYNMALYRFTRQLEAGKAAVHHLAQQMGLQRLDMNLCADADSLTTIQVTQHAGQHDYIPYTDKKLSWHTDGYYNAPEQAIHGMLLHCVRPAVQGGETLLMDQDIAYILLREANPAYITALLHPQAFTIPANILNHEVIRPTQSGQVFTINADGSLHMRYSARQKNVIWRDDPMTQAAAAFLLELWEQDSPYKLRHTLQTGEGVICNNVLHCRSAFVDANEEGGKRLLYRGRYLERVSQPSLNP